MPKFGRLTITGEAPRSRHGHPRWHWQCECGRTGTSRRHAIQTGTTRSCGCLVKERHPRRRTRWVKRITHTQYLDACDLAEDKRISVGWALHLLTGANTRFCQLVAKQAEVEGLDLFESWRKLELPEQPP